MRILKLSRLEALTDGIFAIAMTILVLDLRMQNGTPLSEVSTLLKGYILYKIEIYTGSFIIMGTLWIAMNFQLGVIERLNRPYLWANIIYLMAICLVPFSASLVANYPNSQASIVFFAINLLCTTCGQLLTQQIAHSYNLNKSFYNSDLRYAIVRRIFVGPLFFISSIIVSYWNTHLAFIILVLPIIIYIIPGRIDYFNDGHG